MAFLSTDGTDFSILEQSPFWSGWCSHKFKGAGLRYEIGVGICSGNICWLNGPFPAGKYSDIKIFRLGLKKCIDPGEKVEASNGFRGEPDTILLPSDPSIVSESELLRFTHDKYRMKQRVRARHETVNGRFKNWNILNTRFHNEISLHSNVFRAIVVIT